MSKYLKNKIDEEISEKYVRDISKNKMPKSHDNFMSDLYLAVWINIALCLTFYIELSKNFHQKPYKIIMYADVKIYSNMFNALIQVELKYTPALNSFILRLVKAIRENRSSIYRDLAVVKW